MPKTKNENKKANASVQACKAPKRKHSVLWAIGVSLAAVIGAFFIAALISITQNGKITVADYTVRSEKTAAEGVKLVLISDLHRQKFDKTNAQLVEKTAAQQPDLICIDGDMLERDYTEEEAAALVSLFERLCAIAPVYFAVGNHDYCAFFSVIRQKNGEYLAGIEKTDALIRLEETGAVFLENDYLDTEINGVPLRIGGFYGYLMKKDFDDADSWSARESFLREFCDTDRYKILLSHRPESIIAKENEPDWDIDLILCGHIHNGVVSLPFGLGAIWSNEGFFPEHDRGQFTVCGNDTMIITGGLAGWRFIPRVFNPPEITTVEITE